MSNALGSIAFKISVTFKYGANEMTITSFILKPYSKSVRTQLKITLREEANM